MRRVLLCPLFALISYLGPVQSPGWAAEGEDAKQQAILTLSLPNFPQTRQRLEQGIWGTTWQLPALAPLRDSVDGLAARIKDERGIDFTQLYAHFSSAQAQWQGFHIDTYLPKFSLVADFGPAMDQLWLALSSTVPASEDLYDSDAALAKRPDELIYLRHGSKLSVLAGGMTPTQIANHHSPHDMVMVYSFLKLLEQFSTIEADLEISEQDSKILRAFAQHLGDITLSAGLLQDGIIERIHADMSEEFLSAWAVEAIDRQQVNRFPRQSLMLLAGHLNLGAAAGTSFYMDPAELKNELAAMAHFMPLGEDSFNSLVDLYYAIDGTLVLGLLPSLPFPALAIQLPLNDQSEAALGKFLATLQMELPAPGQRLRLQTVPMLPITLARDEGHVLITSHPGFAANWLQGEGGGAMDSAAALAALAMHHDDATLNFFGISDTPRVLEILRGLVGMAGLLGVEAQQVTMISALLESLRKQAGYGFLIAELREGQSLTTVKSLTGAFTTLPIMMGGAGFLFAHEQSASRPPLAESTPAQAVPPEPGITPSKSPHWESMPHVGRTTDEIIATWKAAAEAMPKAPMAKPDAEDENGEEAGPEVPQIPRSLEWFQRHQSPNGSWSAIGHGSQCTLAGPKVAPDTTQGEWGVGWPERDIFLSAGVTLAYLGAGYDHRTPNRYRRVLSAAINYLTQHMAEGAAPLTSHHTRALVALALAEAFAMTQDPHLREPTLRALDTLLQSALSKGAGETTATVGWPARPGEQVVDLQATLLGVMALKSAEAGGLDVDRHMHGIRQWFRGLLEQSTAQLSAEGRDVVALPQRVSVSYDRMYGEDSAIGLGLAVFLSIGPRQDPRISALAERVMDRILPLETTDPFERYIATLGIFQLGATWWQPLNAVLRDYLIGTQSRSEDCLDGSWPAHPGMQTNMGGSIITSTIFSTLAMQVYYRFTSLE